MKTLFTWLITLTFFFHSFAQINNFIDEFQDPFLYAPQQNTNKWVLKHKLDSIITTYIPSTFQDSKTYYTYNSNGFETEQNTYKLVGNQWSHTYKKIKTYDNQNRKTEEISMSGIYGSLQNSSKNTYQYNPNNLLEIKIFYIWDNSQQTWTNKNKTELTYNNQLTIANVYEWNISQWELSEVKTYTYNNNNQIVEFIKQVIDNGTLINHYRNLLSYDNNDNLTGKIFYFWDETNSQWQEYSKVDYNYNNLNKLIEIHSYQMTSYGWQENIKDYITYDNEQNVADYTSYIKYGANWILSSKVEFTHDNTYTADQLLLPENIDFIDFSKFEHQLVQENYYEGDDTAPTGVSLVGSSEFYYSDIDVNGINEASVKDFLLYPNPASQQVQIELNNKTPKSQFIIYDLTGKEVMKRTLQQKHTSIDIRRLNKGMYFYRVLNEKGISTGKLLIK